MPATATKNWTENTFLLHGISWKVYDALVNELAEEHVSMTYDRGKLELMSGLGTRPDAPGCLLLYGVSWKLYNALVEELAEEHVFMTYDRGKLEFMSPLPKHEFNKNVIHDWITFIAAEMRMNVRSGGNTTFWREDLERGLEPDDCFWIANAAAIRDKIDLDLRVDPPPDLVVEIETTRRLLVRESIYAVLGVPELWRFDGQTLRVFVLGQDGKYRQNDKSPSFPFLPLDKFQTFLHKPAGMPESDWVEAFRQWVRSLHKKN